MRFFPRMNPPPGGGTFWLTESFGESQVGGPGWPGWIRWYGGCLRPNHRVGWCCFTRRKSWGYPTFTSTGEFVYRISGCHQQYHIGSSWRWQFDLQFAVSVCDDLNLWCGIHWYARIETPLHVMCKKEHQSSRQFLNKLNQGLL